MSCLDILPRCTNVNPGFIKLHIAGLQAPDACTKEYCFGRFPNLSSYLRKTLVSLQIMAVPASCFAISKLALAAANSALAFATTSSSPAACAACCARSAAAFRAVASAAAAAASTASAASAASCAVRLAFIAASEIQMSQDRKSYL